jgi:hypothetical protein
MWKGWRIIESQKSFSNIIQRVEKSKKTIEEMVILILNLIGI